MKRMMNLARNMNGIIAVAMASLFLVCISCGTRDKIYSFETSDVKKGSIINTITATGTVEADTTVSVGTQVSGVINKIYVDFNSVVRRGQLLAELDKVPLQSAVQQAEASLEEAKSEVEYQTSTYNRYKDLLDKALIAQADFDQIKYNYEKSLSDYKTAKAGYDRAVVNLNYASILSPISGVILNRAVEQGQTVAASFNTPTLFMIANDLSKMQVQASVDEADIGQVRNGQGVEFAVDAYPAEKFRGTVRQIRLQPVVTSNVVTYTVIVDAPNPQQKLMPGMTANLTILVQQRDSVLVVPGKALRFNPDPAWLAQNSIPGNGNGPEKQRAQGTRTGADPTAFRRSSGERGPNSGTPGNARETIASRASVWVETGEGIHRVSVKTGAADGMNTEIISGLNEGDKVVLSMTEAHKRAKEGAVASSPFMPSRRPQTGTKR